MKLLTQDSQQPAATALLPKVSSPHQASHNSQHTPIYSPYCDTHIHNTGRDAAMERHRDHADDVNATDGGVTLPPQFTPVGRSTQTSQPSAPLAGPAGHTQTPASPPPPHPPPPPPDPPEKNNLPQNDAGVPHADRRSTVGFHQNNRSGLVTAVMNSGQSGNGTGSHQEA